MEFVIPEIHWNLIIVTCCFMLMDIATGSAAFLVAAMDQMICDANRTFGKNTKAVKDAIVSIKEEQLLGIEIDAKMYTLAASNMILRGDGSTQIKKTDTFTTPEWVFDDFGADVLLLNPPFSYTLFNILFLYS